MKIISHRGYASQEQICGQWELVDTQVESTGRLVQKLHVSGGANEDSDSVLFSDARTKSTGASGVYNRDRQNDAIEFDVNGPV